MNHKQLRCYRVGGIAKTCHISFNAAVLMSSNMRVAKQEFEAAMAALDNNGRSPFADPVCNILRRNVSLRDQSECAELYKKRSLKNAAIALASLRNQRSSYR
jgi:hypothetical protein